MKNSIIKRSLKKNTAFLLALSMICSFTQPFIAGATDSSGIGVSSSDTPTQNGIGKVDVLLSSALPIENDIDFTITLSNNYSDYTSTQVITLKKSGEEKISFDRIADGEYTLTAKASGFTAYSQQITVSQKMYTVKLTAGYYEDGYDYKSANGLHPGVMLVGDVNGDGDVNGRDKDILIDVLDGVNTLENIVTDLNHDGTTNLADLTLFAKNYDAPVNYRLAHIEENVSPFAVKIEVPETVKVEGSMEKMLNGEESVVIKPSNNEAISAENPVEVGFDIGGENTTIDGITIETGNDTAISQATIDVAYTENGEDKTATVPVEKDVEHLLQESNVRATIDANGNIHVHLGEQIAVKKVTLKITGMQNNNNLAEISKVEFVNGMEERIPEPTLDIPENFKAEAGSEKFVLKWNPCVNVTGYEVKIEQGGKTEIVSAVSNSMVVTSFKNDDVKNYSTYRVSVQAINGSWKSGYCDAVDVTPIPTKRPDKPDNVKATGGYGFINVSWKKMDDTKSYNVYYRLLESDDEFIKIPEIQGTSYKIEGLQNLTEYEIYATGSNHLGESPQSNHCSARTTDLNLADMPKYNLINRDAEGNPGSTHITNVTRYGGEMIDSPLDEGKNNTAWGAVDGDKASYYRKQETYDGGWNWLGGNGLTYTFDQAYTLDTIGLLTVNTDISFMHVKWWDENGVEHNDWNGAWDYTNFANRRTDANNRVYYLVKLPKAITATKIQIGTGRWSSPNTVAETYFYKYDTLMDEVMDLYVDDLHTVLKDNVTQETIDDLRIKVNTPDEFGEINPNTAALLRELETAEKILNAKQISSAVEIYTNITTADTGRGFGGLNAWQPLGVSIGMGEEVTIYVGCDKKKTGESTNLRLITTQYHSESNGVTLDGANLKVGANTFKLSKGKNLVNQENGGAMYIQYQGNPTNERYSVRVTGGSEIPRLDLYKVTDEKTRKERAVAFVEKLDEYVPQIQELHEKHHDTSTNNQIRKAFNEKNCILGASDIMLDTMMISLPAKQIRAGLGSGTVEQRAEKLLQSMDAMEEMMYLFYQHKGLNASAPTALNQIPKQHLNIRYQQMFSGAFMYAAGNHIGIEWGSATGLVNGVPIQSDENGKYVSGRYFGWGIAHEIGHNINQGTYTVAEITNNYFAQLAQAKDTNEGMRFQYSNIYDKVTSGTKGNCSNIATQLGMYWQLHLAYDKGLNYKTYSNYTEQLNNLFYARVDTYARNVNTAPAPGGVKLNLNGGTDQNLMRLACAASKKNVLEFFERWGKTPDAATIAYAEQFEKETRAIFYANDDSRIYALNGKGSVLGTDSSVKAIENVSVNIGEAANKVDLRFTSKDIPENDILGYEVIRCTVSGGRTEEIPVGFSQTSSFTDTVTTLNNRVVFYKVTLIDQYLNRSAVYTTDMVKIEHDGSMDKKNWTISAEGLTAPAVVHEATEEMPCEQTHDNPASLAVDNDFGTAYTPVVNNDNAEIVINFNKTVTATGMKYTAGEGSAINDYKVYVMTGGEWVLAADGRFSGNGSETVYFANETSEYVSTYSATAMKLVITGKANQTISIAELDVLAPTGDNVDFRRAGEEKTTVIGKLSADYKYGTKDSDVIPKDSIVFTGSYKGNPAYNVVILYDDKGNIVGGIDSDGNVASQQIILADVPDNSNIANVSDGTWIYWIEPDQMADMNMPQAVRVELYRVNNALTNEGQRLVSDSLIENVPDKLPEISFSK